MLRRLKFIAIAAALAAGLAWAGDYLTFQVTQIAGSAASNGMTSAPPLLATDGIAIKSTQSILGSPLATVCRGTLKMPAGTTFEDDKGPKNGQWERCWRYGPDPLGSATFQWARAPYCDWSVTNALDAGTGTIAMTTNALSLPPVVLQGVTNPVTMDGPNVRYDWSGENIEEDAGVTVGVVDGGAFGLVVECFTQ